MADLIWTWSLLILVAMPMTKGSIFTENEEKDITDFVENAMGCRNVPGLTLAVVKGDETWTRGFGLGDLDSGRQITNKTLFGIGSLGKALTMTLLGNMIQKTGYTWNTKLKDIKGLHLKFIDKEITKEATLSDLLAHKTGLSSVADYGFIAGYPEAVDREFLSKRTKYLPVVDEFRNSFQYNNMMYMLLGHLTELLGDDSWENILKSRLSDPIGMTSTKVMLKAEDVQQDNVAKPYIMPEGQLEDGNYDIYRIVPLEPAGAVLSNADDMAKWMRFNLNNGVTQTGHQLLPEDLLLEAFQDQNELPFGGSFISQTTPTFPINDITKAYGYAWFTSTYRGYRRLWHSGGLFSYVSLLWLFPDQQIGVFANLNGPGLVGGPSYALRTISSYVSDILLKETPWLDHVTACSYPSPWAYSPYEGGSSLTLDDFTNDHLEDFVGSYGNKLLPDITISVREKDPLNKYLWLEMNRIQGELLPTGEGDAFRFKMLEPWEYAIERIIFGFYYITYPVEFTRSDDGEVESFVITFSDPEAMKYRKNAKFAPGRELLESKYSHRSSMLRFL